MFPGPNQRLDASGIWPFLAGLDIEFDDEVNARLDEDSPLRPLRARSLNDIESLVQRAHSLEVTARTQELVFTIIVTVNSENPHLAVCWSRKTFDTLPSTLQTFYMECVRKIASSSNAAYVLIAEEASDYFPQGFVEVDTIRVCDFRLPSGNTESVVAVWINHSRGGAMPLGISLYGATEIGDEFVSHRVMVPA